MSPEPDGLSAGEVARQLGVSVTTLRTWHQRYGLGPSAHLPGQHRRYTEPDVARLETMRRLTGQGVPAAEAARLALSRADLDRVAGAGPGTTGEKAAGGETPHRGRAGGGHAIPVGRAGAAARGLANAAMRLDGQTMVDLIATALRDQGVVSTWDGLVRPVLVGIGNRHAATGDLVEVEHLLSRSVSAVLATVPPAAGQARVLLACADEEQHSLPLEALAAALGEHGCPSRLLGARVPPPALAESIRRTGPAAVFVWSHSPETADPAQLRALLTVRPRPALIAAVGPGWSDEDLPPGQRHPASLAEALALALGVAAAR